MALDDERQRIPCQAYVATVDPAYAIVGTGDFDGDGKADLLWRHVTTGDMWMWLMNGAAQKSRRMRARWTRATTVQGVGDLDGDGKADLVWQGTAGDLWAWLMNGAAEKTRAYVGTVADTKYQIEQVADFDGDGRADLLWRGATAGDMWLWTMNGATVLDAGLRRHGGHDVPDRRGGGLRRGHEDRSAVAGHGGRPVDVADERGGDEVDGLRRHRLGHRVSAHQLEVGAPIGSRAVRGWAGARCAARPCGVSVGCLGRHFTESQLFEVRSFALSHPRRTHSVPRVVGTRARHFGSVTTHENSSSAIA